MNPYTQSYIDDAVAGSWLYRGDHLAYVPENLRAPGIAQFTVEDDIHFLITLEQALIDPSFWEAVGYQQGWALHPEEIQEGKSHYTSYAMRFFENVIMRKMSVEDALAAISQEV